MAAKAERTRKLFWLQLLTLVVALAVWGLAIFCMIKLWKMPSGDGANLAVVYPLSVNGTAVRVAIQIGLNVLSTLLLGLSYVFQVAIIAPSETSMLESIGQYKTICVNNIHAPRSPGLSKGMRRCWYILVFTSVLLHGVFNDIIGVSSRYCMAYEPNFYGEGGTYDTHHLNPCRSDVSFRVAPLIVAGVLLLVKASAMQYAYRRVKYQAARGGGRVKSLMDVIFAVNEHPSSLRESSALADELELRGAFAGHPFQSHTVQTRQLALITFEKAAGWWTASIGFCSGLAMVGLGAWMLAVWGYGGGPADGPATSVILPGFEVKGYSDSKPFLAYLETASVAAAPQVMLAIITLINLSILEIFYLNRAWALLELGVPLRALKHHFKWYKPATLPPAGHKGRIGIVSFVVLPIFGHVFAAFALSSQELFCETAPAGIGCPFRTGGGFLSNGTDLSTMWTTYTLVINQIFLLFTGIVFLFITAVALWIARTKPVQRMPPFYGRPEVVDAAMHRRIEGLNEKMRIKWGVLTDRSEFGRRQIGIDAVKRVGNVDSRAEYM